MLDPMTLPEQLRALPRWTKQDAALNAIYTALERWDREERRMRDLRGITKADVRRPTRLPNGDRILTPRRSALARFLTDAALTAIRDWEQEQREAHRV